MTESTIRSALIIFVVAAVTAAIRFLPFMVFKRNVPKSVTYLSSVLPGALIGMIVIYCLRNVSLFSGNHGIPELTCVLVVALLQKAKHNTLLSIISGTLLYMFFMQVIF